MYGVEGTPNLWGTKGVLPTGIGQGALGDCWFLAASAALAEHPSRIKKLFKNQEYPKEGIFEINFYYGGEPRTIVIDDRLPASDYGYGEPYAWPVFA